MGTDPADRPGRAAPPPPERPRSVPVDDPQVSAMLRRSMNLRVATLSGAGVPHITPLRFVHRRGSLFAVTRAVTLVARHVTERPEAVLLLDAERPGGPVLRLRVRATVADDPRLRGWCTRRAAVRYFLRPGSLRDMLRYRGRMPTWWRSLRTGRPGDIAVIEFVARSAEILPAPDTGTP